MRGEKESGLSRASLRQRPIRLGRADGGGAMAASLEPKLAEFLPIVDQHIISCGMPAYLFRQQQRIATCSPRSLRAQACLLSAALMTDDSGMPVSTIVR